ncbi:MAG TPA: condensation domain-containing protein, partial [Steroidobacteraceae bacterium]
QSQLTRHPLVKDAVVVAREDSPGDKRLVAYVVPKAVEPPSLESLRTPLKAQLPDHMIHSAIVTLAHLPLSPNGKLDRRSLPPPEQSANLSRQYEPPRGELEQTLASIWQSLLRLERVGRHDNFFELGGHSLHGMRLITQVSERLRINLPVVTVFRHPTISAMAAVVDPMRNEDMPLKTEIRPDPDQAPLAFSQLQHWNLYKLSERRFLRQITSATRLSGRLNINALHNAIATTVRRQDALRTRIVLESSTPVQKLAAPVDFKLAIQDLTGIVESRRESELLRSIEQFVGQLVNLALGPPFEIRLLKLKDNEHVLLVAMDHIISDWFSMSILLRDVFTAYAQLVRGEPIVLPTVAARFLDYARNQVNSLPASIAKHGVYWSEHITGCRRVRFPADTGVLDTARAGWGHVPLEIGKESKAALSAWCRQHQTTLVMGAFTAYAAAVLRWCNVSEALIQYQTNGRVSADLQNTIGYFSAPLYLRMALQENDTFLDLMARANVEYCSALEHADSSYMESRTPRPKFARNTAFNWIPQGSKMDLAELDGSDHALSCTQVPFEHPILKTLERDTEPFILLYEAEQAISGGVYFALNRFAPETMQRFRNNCLILIDALLSRPDGRIKDVKLQ